MSQLTHDRSRVLSSWTRAGETLQVDLGEFRDVYRADPEHRLAVDTCVLLDVVEHSRTHGTLFEQVQHSFHAGITPTVLLELNTKLGRSRYLQDKMALLHRLGVEMLQCAFAAEAEFRAVVVDLKIPPAEVERVYCDILIGIEAAHAGARVLLTNNRRDFALFAARGVIPVTLQALAGTLRYL